MAGNTIDTSVDCGARARLLTLATRAAVMTAVLLVGLKLATWWFTGSVSLLASLVDSLMDVAASGINLLAVRWALAPPDDEHRFGHGKAESLAGLAQAAAIAGSAAFVLLHAAERLANPRPLDHVGAGIVVMVLSIIATALLVGLQRHVIRRTGSVAIRADSLHYVSDLLTNAGVLLALALALAGWPWADAVIGLVIGAYVLWCALRIGHQAVQTLMDRELPPKEQQRILALAQADPEVLGARDLRTRQAGAVRFVQLQLELDGGLPLARAHEIATRVAAAIEADYPGADVGLHLAPVARAAGEAESR